MYVLARGVAKGTYHSSGDSTTIQGDPKKMEPAQLRRRIELQFSHIEDMIKEQNRMVLAEVEPTNSEREDMLILLSELKNNAEHGPRSLILSLTSRYETVLGDLNELGYNTASYKLVVPEQPNKNIGKQQSRARKQVHFEDQPEEDESSLSDQMYPAIGPASSTSGANFDDPSQSSRQIYDHNDLIMEDQDRRLAVIGDSVGRQRAMGESINSELGVHNSLLEDVEAQVDHSQSRLDRLTNGVKTFNRKSRECGTCSIIMVLVLVLFILLLI